MLFRFYSRHLSLFFYPMKKTLYTILFLLLGSLCNLKAAEFPKISTADNTFWYFIQFANSQNVLTSQGDGVKVQTHSMTGQPAQLWKIEGSESAGFTLTDKTGRHLYLNSTAKQGMAFASSKHQATKLKIKSLPSGKYEVTPYDNSAVALNQWTGPGVGHEVGLWDVGDVNNPLSFTPESALEAYRNLPRLIPYPSSLTLVEGETYELSQLHSITYTNEVTQQQATAFAKQLAATAGIQLNVEPCTTDRKENAISVVIDNTLPDEGYTLMVDAKGVLIKTKTDAGYFYALQTIKQLLPNAFYEKNPVSGAAWTLPQLFINDAPALDHRGFMLDVARHFFDKHEVMRILDIMAFYKMNRFHWHLTDDQGWRVEIPEYPKLTTVGSKRAGSFVNAGGSQQFFDDTEYGEGMYYTLDDLREVVKYAQERNITIIPEIDLPGHMVAAVAAYPELSCDPTKIYRVRIPGGISKDVLNIGKDSTIDFLKCVLGHVATVFPGPYIHLGGDECPTDQWRNNADCLERVRAEGLSGVEQLQSWLVELLGEYLYDNYGKQIIVWDELLAHWPATNKVKPVIMAWNHINKSAEAANLGFKSIVVPYQSLYLDMMQVPKSQADVNEIYQGGWGDGYVNSVPTVYSVNPVSALSGREDYCLGVQGNMWTETCNDNTQLEYQLLPRLLALAETGWLPESKKNWVSFYQRLQKHDELLDRMEYVYARHYIEANQDAWQTAIQEAQTLLDTTTPGEAGYVSAEEHQTLSETLQKAKDGTADVQVLGNAIAHFKAADVVQPQENEMYQIESASTYYKKRYVGSTMYQNQQGVRFHYTPQNEPEELWQFVKTGKGWKIRNAVTQQYIQLADYNKAVRMNATEATVFRLDKATVPAKQYDYVAGALVMTNANNYSATVTGSTPRLFGHPSGDVVSFDDPMLCNPGTWRLVRITQYKPLLEALVKKCDKLIAGNVPHQPGSFTDEAVSFLNAKVIVPAHAHLADGKAVSHAEYMEYAALYQQFLSIPRTSIVESLDESYWYKIRNGYFTDYYAKLNPADNNVYPVRTTATTDDLLWRFVKNADGTVGIISRVGEVPACVGSSVIDQTIHAGTTYSWKLSPYTTDEGPSGFNIIEASGTYSWYTNPDAFQTVLLKPRYWGASIWTFEKQAEKVTSIPHTAADATQEAYYNLQGVKVGTDANKLQQGVYLCKGKKVVVR